MNNNPNFVKNYVAEYLRSGYAECCQCEISIPKFELMLGKRTLVSYEEVHEVKVLKEQIVKLFMHYNYEALKKEI